MKKNVIILLLLLTNISVGVYAYINKLEAEEQRNLAVAASDEADMQRLLAIENEKRAIESAHEAGRQRSEAERQRILAMEQLAKCQKKK